LTKFPTGIAGRACRTAVAHPDDPYRPCLNGSATLAGSRTERLYLRNPGRAGLLALAVRIYHPNRDLDAAYTLSAQRVRG
jgi:hypothetical protein